MEYPALHQYLSDMILCGFDIYYDDFKINEDSTVPYVEYLIDNGSSLVLVCYDAQAKTANVYYEPGIDRYLFEGADYSKYIPKP